MKALTIVLFIVFIFFVIAWKAVSFFAYKVSFLGIFVDLFLWIWIGALIAAAVFSVLLVIKELRNHKGE